MQEQGTLFDKLRWTILLPKAEVDKWEDTDFKMVAKVPNCFTDEYSVLLIEPLTTDCQYTAEDVLEITDALAVHEEFTNGVLTTPEGVEEIGDNIYCWQGSGGCFLGDMLTEVEKLSFLMHAFYVQRKEVIKVEDIDIVLEKNGPKIPLTDNVDKLFSNDIYEAVCKDTKITIWWASIIEDAGLFLVVLDDELLEDDEDDDEEVKKLPAPKYYPWNDYYNDYYDDYDYDDRYYRRY